MDFPQKVVGEPLLYRLSTKMKVKPNVIRGRITEKHAQLEIEIIGASKNIELAVKYLVEKGVAVTKVEET
jgi:ABC-type methionine transport system ATPase subunit